MGKVLCSARVFKSPIKKTNVICHYYVIIPVSCGFKKMAMFNEVIFPWLLSQEPILISLSMLRNDHVAASILGVTSLLHIIIVQPMAVIS